MRAVCALIGFIALGLTLASFQVSAQPLPVTTVCNHCYSDASFEYQAEQASLFNNPLLEGVDFVYVINLASEAVRHFEVERWIDDTTAPQAQEQGIEWDYGSARAEATEIPGDPQVLLAIGSAINAIKTFGAQAQDVSSDELGLNFGSAVSLVGPEDSLASARRGGLRNMLHQHYNALWRRLALALTDLAFRFSERILPIGIAQVLSNITIHFPDGTQVQVQVTEVRDPLDGDIGFEFVVKTDTVYGPGLQYVPQSQGEFNGFVYAGSDLTLAELIQLARLYGIPIVEGGSGNGPSMECEISGGEIRCTVRSSGY